MIIHVMIMTYNTWMSVKEASLKHVFSTGTSSDIFEKIQNNWHKLLLLG